MEHYNSMVEAIAAVGLGTPHIIHDGDIHRWTSPDDRPGSNNCWFISFGTGGAFGSWKLDIRETWSSKKDMTLEESLKLRQQIRVAEGHRRADLEIQRRDTAAEAKRLWLQASDVIDHPYPANKRITPYSVRQNGNALVVPMHYQGELWNLQRIYPDGKKRFLKGGRVTGCYHLIGAIMDRVYVTEGYATACSLHEHTGKPIIVAFNAGNLKTATLAVYKAFPDIKITVACDNDVNTDGNPGMTKGRAAAAAVGGDIIYPVFEDEDFDGTDFNDYLTHGGEL